MVSAGIYQVPKDELEQNPARKRDHEGIVEKRHTTDVLFLILIWLMWAAMSYVGYTGTFLKFTVLIAPKPFFSLGIKTGNPYRLIAPTDYQGHACGYQGDISNKYAYTVVKQGLVVCISSCPDANAALTSVDPNDYYCFDQVPSDSASRSAYISSNCFSNGAYSIDQDCLCNTKRQTTDVLKRCVFTETAIRTQYSNQSAPSYFQRFIADIYTARGVIFGFGFGLAIVLSFLWSHLLQIRAIGLVLVWGGLVGTVVFTIALVIVAQTTVKKWRREDPAIHSSEEIYALDIFSWLLLAASILFFFMMVFLRKQINLSVNILSLTAHCINDMKFIVFTPIINITAIIIFLVPSVIYWLYVASDGQFETIFLNSVPVGKKYVAAPGVVDRLFFLFFCLLWTMAFIGGISSITIAMSCAKWYFTENRGIFSVNSLIVFRSYATTVRYHWGTAAFGGLLIAIVQFVRWFLLYIQKHYSSWADNRIMKFVCCCAQCCLWCLEKIVKFISKNAYIQTAIHV